MQIRYANKEDIPAIRAIYNAGIESGTGTFETRPRRNKDIAGWLKVDNLYPLLVAESEGQVLGFARLYEYRPRECYAGIAEFSIYLADEAQGKGTGTLLLAELLTAAGTWGFHKVISRIFTFNQASRALCKKLGFREVGIYEKHGQINGRWLDVVIVEYLVLPSRSAPAEI
ncbi:arsinothricin resistance N-acetyltransferase ArsN1 family A [Lacimicrobium alkaliphilum]|uniref:GCN5 family acetyltransferase n=1 Tax=Lacimicrobium alkaliphilum TaxID=1526571 RepID=A0A0U3B2H9_9ALTE|nr:arsinothricin resistance N-acetyltransferase ArsN1 family A [Lacimicrobium alkaliphilum]ALS99448.1 GCN5 family acetyltransferase [Lacimicrobium alkaliphilum]